MILETYMKHLFYVTLVIGLVACGVESEQVNANNEGEQSLDCRRGAPVMMVSGVN